MRVIKGFVCVAVTRGKSEMCILFGSPRFTTDRFSSSSIASNGLSFFGSTEEAKNAKVFLGRRRDFKKVWIARIKMVVAESSGDLKEAVFQRSKSLVVIWHKDGFIDLIGRIVSGRPYYEAIGVARLFGNGLKPFQCGVDDTRQRASETSRQSDGSKVEIATFHLQRVRE